MHPLLAHIHPALRTALLAWLTSRAALWAALLHTGTWESLRISESAPLSGVLSHVFQVALQTAPAGPMTAALTLAPWVLVELATLWATLNVYRFARNTELPQVAERAAWLWCFNPLLALNATDWTTSMAAALGAGALASLVTYRPRTGALAALVAMGLRLEFIVMWPAMMLAGYRAWRPGKDPKDTPWLGAVVPPVAFAGWMMVAWHSGQLRHLHGDAAWRDFSALTLPPAPELLLLTAAVGAALLALRYASRHATWYLVAALPALVWPFFQVPASFAAVTFAWALPTAVHLALATDDRAVERPLFAGLIIAFMLCLPGVNVGPL
ncbi:hypothetical protein DL240_17965 [Lujinxingia litoralis]|uniref:Uncharacterized protein n=1 Tax=Lujinxingia litoralis TaxID=2211119 RepID=A0A328C115_9DELT|nr:hypothetical protein [Lujinxingia litoralis]RAL20266.1 hypothetical protein DL240_17965 [Lujinxingia litoralis]